MGGEVIRFDPRRAASQQLKALKEQNLELRNSNAMHAKELRNGLSGLTTAAFNQFNITSFNPLFQANIAAPITLNYTFLNYFYKTHGIIRTAVMQPVLDALRGGINVKSGEMEEEKIEEMMDFVEEHDILNSVVGVASGWSRLFGGGAIIVNDGASDMSAPLPEDGPIRELRLYPASRWELGAPHKLAQDGAVVTTDNPWEYLAAKNQDHYNYYGQKLHKTRVITMSGAEAPWMIRWQLQGWGMSIVEQMIEDFNLYIRTRNVLYDLLNEAKVDVFMVEGLSDTLLSPGGEQKVLRRTQTVQMAKNMNNALLMDSKDTYEQKQLTFTGIADVMRENKMGIASACRMPISKIFGIGATGFSSGEDDIENYVALVESECRQPMRPAIRKVLNLIQRHLWGAEFQTKIEFKPLRIMSAKDEEDVKDKKFNRGMAMVDHQMMTSEEMGDMCHKEGLISVETAAQRGELEEFPEVAQQEESADAQMGRDKELIKSKPKASKGK